MSNANFAPLSQSQNHNFLKQISVFVPTSFIGAVIGSKGTYVKLLQQTTNTTIRVDQISHYHSQSNAACLAIFDSSDAATSSKSSPPPKPHSIDEYSSNLAKNVVDDALSVAVNSLDINSQNSRGNQKNHSQHDSSNRCVNIEGEDEDILKAVFWIYQRVAEIRGVNIAFVQLHIQFKVRDEIVGHIIGKGGASIYQLKRISMGCDVLVNSKKDGSDAIVCLFGAFGPCLVVVCRINNLRRLCANPEGGIRRYTNGNNRSSSSAINEVPISRTVLTNNSRGPIRN